MPYIVRIVGPSGREQYLSHGVLVEEAYIFPTPSPAIRAMQSFMSRHGAKRVAEVLDIDDLEAGCITSKS